MRRRRLVPSLFIALMLAGLLAPGAATAANAAGTKVKVLIGYERHPGRADVRAIERLGGTVKRRFTVVDAIAAEVPKGQLRQLARQAGVRRVEKDATLKIFDHIPPTGDLEWDYAWGVAHIGTPAVYNAGITGHGVKVAVIDSGIDYLHDDPTANPPVYPEFNGIYAGGHDFFNNDDDPYDDNGHGTHVSGIIAAAKNGYLVAGVAPEVQLYALKIVDANGEGQYSDLIAALQWVVNYNNTNADDIDVINMSVGAHDVSTALHDAIQAVAAQGVLMAAAAGNINPLDFNEIINGCPVVFPAAYPEVLATTFTQEDNALTGWSCTGPEVDVASPGDNILSTVPTGSCMFCSSTGYNWESGTSMASPHLAGLLALLLDAGLTDQGTPGLLDDARAAICSTADDGYGVISGFSNVPIPKTDPRYPKYFGCGVINADGAVFGLTPPPPPPPNTPPVAVDDTASTNEDVAKSIAVLANDTDVDGNTLSVDSVTVPAHGTAVKQANGTVTYTPAANYHGSDAFDYVVSDGAGGTDTGSVAVTVVSVNDPPVANDDTASTPYQTAVAVPVLANDTDIDGDTLSVVSVGAASHGAVTIGPGGSVTYTPGAGYSGPDSFNYTAGDGAGGTDVGAVSITVGAAPPPVAPFHVGDLDRSTQKSRNSWLAKVTITVQTATNAPLSGAVVTGTWSSGGVVTVVCTTNSNGKCTVQSGKLPTSTTSVTFTVTLVAKTGATYDASANHDPDGDSNGTTIVVTKP
jgi:subtilisin family serine protease